MTLQEQAHFRILRLLEQNPEQTQRQLAEDLGVSVGKINYIVNALVEKGLIKIGNFQKSGHKLNKIAYLLTPEGVRHRILLTRTYLARKEAEYHALTAEIEAVRSELNGSVDGLDSLIVR